MLISCLTNTEFYHKCLEICTLCPLYPQRICSGTHYGYYCVCVGGIPYQLPAVFTAYIQEVFWGICHTSGGLLDTWESYFRFARKLEVPFQSIWDAFEPREVEHNLLSSTLKHLLDMAKSVYWTSLRASRCGLPHLLNKICGCWTHR